MLIYVLCLLIAGQIPWISCKCTYENFNFEYPPVFTQEIAGSEIILKPLGLQITISEGASLNAYCDSNFSTPIFGSRSEPEGVSSVRIICSKGVLYYEDTHDEERRHETREQLTCFGSQPEFYAISLQSGCNNLHGNSLAYGIMVNQNPIVLSTFCFHFDTMDLVYIHYKSSEKSLKLKDARNHYDYMSPERKVAMNFLASNENRTSELNSYIRRNSAVPANIGLFKFDSLVPNERLVKSYNYQMETLEGPNSIPWWINLKEGNWKLFEKLLEKEMVLNDYDVYTGVSHSYEVEAKRFAIDEAARQRELELQRNRDLLIQQQKEKEAAREEKDRSRTMRPYVMGPPQSSILPMYNTNRNFYNRTYNPPSNNRRVRSAFFDNFYEDESRYVSGSVVKSVPLYVWTYLKSPTGDANSTVVIGVNSPFIEVNKFYRIDFCRENCPIWLDELSESAKIPALGYMFCCRPETARDYIQSLP